MNDDIKKILSLLAENSSYETRVKQVVGAILELQQSRTFSSKEDLLRTINDVSLSNKITDYTIGGSARKDFIKDVLLALKGHVKIQKDTKVKDSKSVFLEKLSFQIEKAASESFPDVDPFDAISEWGRSHRIYITPEMLDAASKKYLGTKTYSEYLANMWAQFADDNPDNTMDVRLDNNPWK